MANSMFHHEEILRGEDLVKKLEQFQVTVCGGGAIGSNIIETMVRQGFTNIRVIDFDRVEIHNISTQIFMEEDIGSLKVAAIANKMSFTTGVDIETFSKKLEKSNVTKLLKDSDLVIDAFDNAESRQLIQNECRTKKIPCLHAGLGDNYGEVAWNNVYMVPEDTEGDVCDYPLARNLVMFVVSIAAEEVVNFCLEKKPRLGNWSITLKDFKIRPYV